MRRSDEVVLVVRRPGPQYLVLLRSPECDGYWHLVAGGIEAGEHPEAAARRELEEETGLSGPRVRPLALPLGYRRADGSSVTLHPFVVEAPAGWEPTLNEEHVEYGWYSEGDAIDRLLYPEPQEAIRAAAQTA